MRRVPEPELMLGDDQARAYAGADFEEPHRRFLDLLSERLPEIASRGAALDLGCGPGDITLRFARAFPEWAVDALDGSRAMLDHARTAVAGSDLEIRVRFHEAVLPANSPPRERYDLVFSNSLLHHLADPAVLWSSISRWTRPGGFVFVMDLLRPPSARAARELVSRYAPAEPDVLQADFYSSLLAAFRPAEVKDQLGDASLAHLDFEIVSDRHFIVWGRP